MECILNEYPSDIRYEICCMHLTFIHFYSRRFIFICIFVLILIFMFIFMFIFIFIFISTLTSQAHHWLPSLRRCPLAQSFCKWSLLLFAQIKRLIKYIGHVISFVCGILLPFSSRKILKYYKLSCSNDVRWSRRSDGVMLRWAESMPFIPFPFYCGTWRCPWTGYFRATPFLWTVFSGCHFLRFRTSIRFWRPFLFQSWIWCSHPFGE